MAYTPTEKGNVSIGWAGTIADDAAAGSVAWTNPSNAKVSDDAFATCALSDGQSSHRLKATNFNFDRAIPSGATVLGFLDFIEGRTTENPSTITDTEVLAVRAGTTEGTNAADGQALPPVSGSNEQTELKYGSGANLRGLAWTADQAQDATSGLTLRLTNTGSLGDPAQTAKIDAIKRFVYWSDTPACNIVTTRTGSASAASVMAGSAVHFHAGNSVWGTSRAERVGIKWESDIPGGAGWYSLTSDPRPGDMNGLDRDPVKGAWGWNMGFRVLRQATPGTYHIWARMFYEGGPRWGIKSNVITITVTADTRTVKYVRPTTGQDGTGGHDGSSAALAWKTLEYAFAHLASNQVLQFVADGVDDFTPGASPPTLDGLTNVLIIGPGAHPAISGANLGMQIQNCTDIVLDNLYFPTNAAHPYAVGGQANTGICFSDCTADGRGSVYENTDSGITSEVLLFACAFTNIARYSLYLGGNYARDAVCIGCTFQGDNANTGEGPIRLGINYGITTNSGSQTAGVRANIMWCTFDANGVNRLIVRPGWSYVHLFQNYDAGTSGRWVYSENPEATSAPIQSIKRFDGNFVYWPATTALPMPPMSKGLCVVNEIINMPDNSPAVEFSVAGRYHNYQMLNCLILPAAGTSTNGSFKIDSGASVLLSGFEAANCLFPKPDPTNLNGRWWVDAIGGSFARMARNVYSGSQSGSFQISGVDKTLAQWNALSFIEGGDVADPIDTDNIDGSYKPSQITYTVYGTACLPEPGVWCDRRGYLRDQNAATWAAGAVGNEPPAPPILVATGGAIPHLDWSAVDDIHHYNVYRATSSEGLFSLIGTALAFAPSYDDSAVSGRTYYYKVTAVDATGHESGPSYEASAVVPKTILTNRAERANRVERAQRT